MDNVYSCFIGFHFKNYLFIIKCKELDNALLENTGVCQFKLKQKYKYFPNSFVKIINLFSYI